MERKAIAIQGISTSSNYDDGACLNMINMRHEQGVLKPVESFPVDFTLKHVYDLLYWHKNNDYSHLIGVRGSSVYWIQNPGSVNETEGNSLLTVSNTTLNPTSLSHIGNLINVLDGETLKYIFWQDGAYFVIDMDFDGEQSDTTLGPVKVDLKVDGNSEFTAYASESTYDSYANIGEADNEDLVKSRAAVIDGLISNGLLLEKNNGNLTGFATAITAIELYDGSFILPSHPVLLGQSYDLETRYDNSNGNYLTKPIVAYNNLCFEKITNTENNSFEVSNPRKINYVSFGDGSRINNYPGLESPYYNEVQWSYFQYNQTYHPGDVRLSQQGTGWFYQCKKQFTYLQSEESNYFDGQGMPTALFLESWTKLPNFYLGDVDFVETNGYGWYRDNNGDFHLYQRTAVEYVSPCVFPNIIGSFYKMLDSGGGHTTGIRGTHVVIRTNKLKFKINTNVAEAYRPIIKSISVFISKEISQYKDSTSKVVSSVFIGNGHFEDNYLPPIKTNAEILTELKANQQFYKVHEIVFDDIVVGSTSPTKVTPGEWVSIDLKGKLGDNLYVQQELSTAAFSNIKARNQMTYNSMLHAWDIKNVIGRGWPLNYFYANQGTGQFPATEETNAVESGYAKVKIKTDVGVSTVVRKYTGNSWLSKSIGMMLSYPDRRATEITLYRGYGNTRELLGMASIKDELYITDENQYIEISAQTAPRINVALSCKITYETGDPETPEDYWSGNLMLPANQSIVRYYATDEDFNNGIKGPIVLSEILGLITQNDGVDTYYSHGIMEGAKEMYGDYVISSAKKLVFPLKTSDSGNFAYYVSADLKPINFPTETIEPEAIPEESNQQLSYQNKLKVSNTNNPFIFPDAKTYQIGDGRILNVASQSIRTSDGQFGQYPLVCFCTDGIFTLQVGDGTVAYSKVGTPQNYERPVSKVICVTPYGIAFISNRGLCMVAGQDIQYLSETMFEKFRTITLELPDQISSLFALDSGTFNDYMKACTEMIYNPKDEEIIMINPAKAYNYVYNMSTKQFYRNTETITNEIDNSLPDMQVWTGATIKKVTAITAGSRAISFVTRPIKMQTPDIKRFERVILRAYLSGISGTPATACIWGSLDDRNFKLLRGMVLTNNTTRKDIDLGLFGKTTYRSYIIGLSMTVGTDSEIEAVEMQIEQEFVDTKMR